MQLRAGGNDLRVDQLVDGKVVLRHMTTNVVRQVSDHELIDAVQSGQVELLNAGAKIGYSRSGLSETIKDVVVDIGLESAVAVETMLAKRRWLDALERMGITRLVDEPWVRVAIDKLAKSELAGVQRFEISTLRTAARKVHQAGGEWTVLIPRYSERGGRGKPRTDARAEAIIQQKLTNLAKARGPIEKQKVIDDVRDTIRTQNLALPGNEICTPGASTISRRIEAEFTKYDLCVRNKGRKYADRLYRNNALSRAVAAFPLLVAEYDDTDCGVFLIDQKIGLPHGRAYLTAGVCQNTAVPLGADLGYMPRSYESAMGAIADSLRPKDMSRPEFRDCKNPWIGYGAQGTILVDNASYNKSKAIQHRREEIQLMLAGTKPYGPTEKCAIEHFNDVLKRDFCSTLPGWRGDKRDADAVKYGMSHAILSIEDFRRLFMRWVTDQYLNDPGDDGKTPRQRWQSHFRQHGPAVRWTHQQVEFLRLQPDVLTFGENGGLRTLCLRYWSEQLSVLKKELGFKAEVPVFFDPKDVSYLMVQNPRTKTLIRVPCVMDEDYVQGLTRYQQKLIVRFARSRKINNPDMGQLVSERRAFATNIEQLARSKKLTERRMAKRSGDVSLPDDGEKKSPNRARVPTVEVVMTELEYAMHELDTIELSEEDAW